jgi:hypothetical protein
LIAVFEGGVSPGATVPTLSTHILIDFWFVVVWSILSPIVLSISVCFIIPLVKIHTSTLSVNVNS